MPDAADPIQEIAELRAMLVRPWRDQPQTAEGRDS
jgi:hypothetical protein